MKKLMMLFTAALLLLAGVCSAQTQTPTPKQKAKQFVEQIFECINQTDLDLNKLEKVGTEMGQYLTLLDEGACTEFCEEFAAKVYEYSDKYGYGKEFADQFLTAMVRTMSEPAEETE